MKELQIDEIEEKEDSPAKLAAVKKTPKKYVLFANEFNAIVAKLKELVTQVVPQVNSDWDATTGTAQILNKPAIPTIIPQAPADWNAVSGGVRILNKPTIPTISGTANKLPKYNATGNNIVNSSITDSGGLVTIANPTEITSGTAGVAGLKFNNLTSVVAATSSLFANTPLYSQAIVKDSKDNLYVTAGSINTVTKITPAGVVTTFATISAWAGGNLVIDNQDNLYAGCSDGVINKVTPAGVVTVFYTLATPAIRMTIDAANNLYTTRGSSTIIYKITPTGTLTTFCDTGGTFPYGLLFDPASGNVYVSKTADNQVLKINSSGTITNTYNVGTNPRSIIMDSDGNVFVSNYNSGTISKIATTGAVTVFATGLSNPSGLAIDNTNNIFVTTNGSNQVYKVTASGIKTILGSTGSEPMALVLSGNTVYTANNGSSVTKLTLPSAKDLLSVNSTGDVVANSNIVTETTGLVLLPNTTNALIATNNKAAVTKEYLGSRIGTIAPASSSDIGTKGEIRVVTGYIYWCVGTNSWVRTAGAVWDQDQ
jgi:DNA-binding beta-propeller fold protein YncE